MSKQPSLKKSNPVLLRLLGEAAVKAGTDNDEPGMVAAGERALRIAEESGRASRKAIRKGKSGFVIEGGHRMIIEK